MSIMTILTMCTLCYRKCICLVYLEQTLFLQLQNGIFTSSTSKTIILFATDESLYSTSLYISLKESLDSVIGPDANLQIIFTLFCPDFNLLPTRKFILDYRHEVSRVESTKESFVFHENES